MRLYSGFPLLDVRDVEAHVRTLLDARLRAFNGAYLDPVLYDAAVAYLVGKCWELAGVEADGVTARRPHYACFRLVPAADPELPGRSSDLGPYGSRELCEHYAFEYASTRIKRAGWIATVRIVRRRQRGSYDPAFGLSFSTYSRRTLTQRVTDWYRSTFGDSRYDQTEPPLSLDEYWATADAEDAYLDRLGPGAVDHFIDQLNLGAYTDQTESVLFQESTRAALAG